MNTQLTVDHLLELIDALPKERAYDYVIAGDNKAVLHFVNIADQTISIDKENVNGTIKSANITSETINIIANGIKAYIPFTMDSILNGSGSSRSAWETIIANTSEFYKCMINRNKHLVWIPDSPHEIGQICEISEKELPSGTNNYLEPSIANFITRYDKQKYSFEELVNIFKRIHDEAKENRKRVQAVNMYGILYAPHLLEYKVNGPDSIAARALGNDNIGSMGDEMGRGIAIGMILREHLKPTISPNKNKTLYTATSTSYLPYLTALRTKPFMLLAGISGTGKSRIVREMAKACWTPEEDEYGKNCPRNFCMVQVKPNWHDSSDLIGYVSRINGEKYVVGPFLRFIAKAIKDPKRPYFLCLDEMNLAPVEQYFAEYLSVIESRKLQDGQIETDPIVPYENTEAYGSLIDQLFDSDEERKAYKTEEGGKRLTVPENLFVVGTVNMDETTFSFSRKVLDRAMTIEMNEVDLKGGLEAGGSAEFGYIGEDMMGDAAEGKDIYTDNQALCDDIITYLGKVNEILEGTPFKIAYRTRNEFLLYAVNRLHFATDSELWQTLDEMTSMKILSRIEGDSERCERVLREMKQLLTETVGEHAPDSVSLKKIDEMTLKLKSGYTSYWA